MKAHPVTQPASKSGTGFVKSFIVLVTLSAVGVTTWQLGQVNPPAPYRAPSLRLHLTGATVGNFDFSAGELVTGEADPTGFTFATGENAALRFRLEFSGSPQASRGAAYDLTADYPLTLTLLGGDEAGATFSASEGTATFGDEGGRVAAFMTDKDGRRLFLGASFSYPETNEACSETYWFCLNTGEVAARGS